MNAFRIVTGLAVCLFSGVVVADNGAGAVADRQGFELRFLEQENNGEPYPVRILVTDDYLRMDDGKDNGDYLLMVRSEGKVHSVTHDTQSVLDIVRQTVDLAKPEDYKTEDAWVAEHKAPKISGKDVFHYTQTAAGKTCADAVVAEGLLPEVTRAFREFHLTMAGQQARTMQNTPKEFRTNCFMARLVFDRAPFLERGFPVVEWDSKGYRRQLLDFAPRDNIPARLFDLPENYEHYSIGEAIPL